MLVVAAGLLLIYLVPHWVRHRQQLSDSHVGDRYSADLRVVAVSSAHDDAESGAVCDQALAVDGTRRGHVLHAATSKVRKEMAVLRPYGIDDRAAARAQRHVDDLTDQLGAARARRSAANKRRLAVTAVLLLVMVGGAAVAVAGAVTWIVAAVAGVLLAGVLVAGRRAVVAGAASDAAMVSELEAAQSESDAVADMASRRRKAPSSVMDFSEPRLVIQTEVIAEVESVEVTAWTPVPVPAPTYAMKARAPRMVPAPLAAGGGGGGGGGAGAQGTRGVASDSTRVPDAVAQPRSEAAVVAETASEVPVEVSAPAARRAPGSVPGMPAIEKDLAVPAAQVQGSTALTDAGEHMSLDLDAVLSRRRASGQ